MRSDANLRRNECQPLPGFGSSPASVWALFHQTRARTERTHCRRIPGRGQYRSVADPKGLLSSLFQNGDRLGGYGRPVLVAGLLVLSPPPHHSALEVDVRPAELTTCAKYLLQHPGIAPEHIAVKTSSKDELKEVDDVGGLLSRDCPIRFIITKQALQEGWDCPFAYLLTILTNPMSRTGITQLVGRILRQPYASKTGMALLDESYVFCFSRRGNELLKEVRKGLGLEGLQGLEGRVVSDDGPFRPPEKLITRQRARYRTAARDLVLPAFMIRDLDGWRLVHYEADILSRVRWDDIDLSALGNLKLGERGDGDAVLVTNLAGDASVSGQEAAGSADAGIAETPGDADSGNGADPVDYFFAASHLLDLVPNPWQGRDLARRTFEALLERYPVERVAANHVFVLEELRRRIERERDRLSREVFRALLESGRMRFLVVAEEFTRLPEKIEVPKAKQANREDGSPY